MVDGRASRTSTGSGAALTAAILGLAVTLWGCGGSRGAAVQPARPLTADDFRSPEAEESGEAPIPVYSPERPRAERVEIRTLTEREARGDIEEIGVEAGEPDTGGEATGAEGQAEPGAPPAIAPGDLELVDANVGDLNGRPILARSWLEPLGARLRAELAGKPRAEWRAEAAKLIAERLAGELSDELYLAEARSSLTPEEKAGLRTFIRRFERDIVRGSYGSRTEADEWLRQTSNMSLEEATREHERLTLIREQLRTKVWNRVQVSSRDLQLEYERNYDEFNPPPQAVFRLIRVRTSEPETIAAFGELLATTPFQTVAEDERNMSAEPAVRPIPDGLESAELFGPTALQEAAAALTPGEFAGPIDAGTFTYWVYLDRIETTSRSLYDAQLELRDQITTARRMEEESRYLLRLYERAGIRGLNELTIRLVDIAERWYFEPAGG